MVSLMIRLCTTLFLILNKTFAGGFKLFQEMQSENFNIYLQYCLMNNKMHRNI